MSHFSILRQQAGLTIPNVADITGYTERTVYRWEKGGTSPRRATLDLIRSMRLADSDQGSRWFSFIDLFAGIGGLRRGFETIGGQCIFTSEWNKYAQQTYLANFDCSHDIAGDITQIPEGIIPPHDVLLAGFPCQPFSIAGVSKKNSLNRPHGFRCDAQGTLFFDVARIIDYHRPQAFLLENVKNLVTHDKGRTFEIINRVLTEELGYRTHWKVIDASSWVPQHRERVFMVGFRQSNGFTFDDLLTPDILARPRLESILHPENGTEPPEKPYTLGSQGNVAEKYTLSDNLWNYLQNYAKRHREKGNGFGFGLVGEDDIARTLSARYYKDGSEILIRQGDCNPRRLTPRECARLMGFDRPGKQEMIIPVSDTQAYKQFGNAVVVPAVETVARHMAPWIVGERSSHRQAGYQRELFAIV